MIRNDGYVADLDRLVEVTDRMATAHADLHRLADHLDDRNRALHLTWQGEAAEAHRVAQLHWDAGFSQMRDALARMRRAATTAHDNYAATADGNLSLWRQVE